MLFPSKCTRSRKFMLTVPLLVVYVPTPGSCQSLSYFRIISSTIIVFHIVLSVTSASIIERLITHFLVYKKMKYSKQQDIILCTLPNKIIFVRLHSFIIKRYPVFCLIYLFDSELILPSLS